MALNAASHNPTGEKTGAISGQPPPLANDVKDAILGPANDDVTGQSAPGQDGGARASQMATRTGLARSARHGIRLLRHGSHGC